MKHRLMNEAVEGGESGAAPVIQTSDDSINHTLFKEMGIDPAKYGITDEPEQAPLEESQGSEEAQEAGQVPDEKSYLEWVNSLGAERNGESVKVESIEQVKNALQMFGDYTAKTQSLSEERKSFELEREQATKEVHAAIEEFNRSQQEWSDKLQELEMWTFTLNQLKQNAPDLHEEITRAYDGTRNQYSNPIINQQLQALRNEIEPLKKNLSSREDELIIKGFVSEWDSLKATEQSLKELGVNVDRDAVKSHWAKTGLSVKEAMGALYFEQMYKAQASKSKVAATAAKTSAKPAGVASSSRPGSSVPNIKGKTNYLEAAQLLYSNMKG